MIYTFSGDPFLTARASANKFKALGFKSEDIQVLDEDLNADRLSELAAQSGLFGQTALLLNFDIAFKGQAGVKARNATLKRLEQIQTDNLIIVLDLNASKAREKIYKKIGEYVHYPSPRFNALSHWIRSELKANKIRFEKDVPDTLADIFGEDLPSIASEIEKLKSIDDELSSEDIRKITNRPASRDAFDLIEATANGKAKESLLICRSLIAQGESPARVLGALSWQYNLVAQCVALKDSRARVDANLVTQSLKINPYVAKKALAIAQKLNEQRLRQILQLLLETDMAIKSAKDEIWALESLALQLSEIYSR